MHINKFKNIPGNPSFYSDTDSIILQHALVDSEVGNELGKMKLEHHIQNAVFIGPKLYG